MFLLNLVHFGVHASSKNRDKKFAIGRRDLHPPDAIQWEFNAKGLTLSRGSEGVSPRLAQRFRQVRFLDDLP
jgi:hypothetical protein